jgi:foldase protein PrsA
MLPSVVGRKGRQKKGGARSAGLQRLALIGFAAVFVLLFVGFAIAQGIGAPGVPSGDVAIVKGVPGELGEVSEEEFQKAFDRQVKGSKQKAPKPGTEKYEELTEKALGEILDTIWIQGEGEELDITVTPKQIETELASIKKQSFKTPKAYQEFLKESGFSAADVNERVKVQVLTSRIQEQVTKSSPTVSSGEIGEYYEAEKATQFTTPASRDVRVILNKDKGEIDKAKAELEKDKSPAGWKKAANAHSSDPTTKSKGGLQEGITEEFVRGELKSAIFDSATGELVGPVKYEENWFLIEPVKLNPEKVKSLGEVKSQISQTLTQERQQEYFSEFVADYQSTWQSRTHCASGYVIQQCANFEGQAHPTNAPPGCYEANPKEPATACPAPVTPNSPALPGTITRLKPKGEPFPQRPLPEPAAEPAAAEAPPTAPPTGE